MWLWTPDLATPSIGAMNSKAVARGVLEAERAAAVGWCGAGAAERPGAALRQLVKDLGASEGASYDLVASGLDRASQILLLTLCGRYGLQAVRRKGQRHNTVVVRGQPALRGFIAQRPG